MVFEDQFHMYLLAEVINVPSGLFSSRSAVNTKQELSHNHHESITFVLRLSGRSQIYWLAATFRRP